MRRRTPIRLARAAGTLPSRAFPRRVATGALFLLAAAAVPAASPAGAAPAPAASALPAARGAAVAASRAAAVGIRFAACPRSEMLPKGVTCGTVGVPLDYTHPRGRQIRLTVSRSRAGGKAGRQGALVYNPGGPGASGMTFPALAGLPGFRGLAAAYDLVGYAPRGVGRSAPLSCEDPRQFDKAPTSSPEDPSAAFERQRIAAARAYVQGCRRHSGEALRYYSTLDNVHDLEVLRAALGERRLTFVGASYGTYLGAVYATLYPSHVRRMVLDSAVDPDPAQVWYRGNLAQSLAFEGRWRDFRSWVAKHDAVYHLGRTPAAVQRSYEKVRASVTRHPAGGRVGTAQLHAAMLSAAYYDDYWAMRATALSRFLKGDERPLVAQASPQAVAARDDENAAAVYTAVECNDARWPARWRVWDRDNTALARRAPFETWDNVWTNLPCAFWPWHHTPVDVRAGRGALPRTLILAAERDGATPYRGALEMQRRLAGAALVTERNAGTHGVAWGGNACVDRLLERYLLTGRTPVRRAVCAPHAEPNPVSLERRAADARPPHAV